MLQTHPYARHVHVFHFFSRDSACTTKTNSGTPRTATRGCAPLRGSAATSAAHVRRSEVARPAHVKGPMVVGPTHASDSGSFETGRAVHARLGHVKGCARRPPHHDDAHARPVHTVSRRVVLETSQDTHFGVHSGNVDRGTQERIPHKRRRDVVVIRSAYTLVVESMCDLQSRLLRAHVLHCMISLCKNVMGK